MNKKVEKYLILVCRKSFRKAVFGQFSNEWVEKWVINYVKFLDIASKITYSIAIMFSFAYFFPIYVGLGYERTTLIVLIIILLHLRLGKTTVKFD